MHTYGTFDFGLSDEQEARATRLHRDSVICDLAFQGPGAAEGVWTEDVLKELQSNGGGDGIFKLLGLLVDRAMAGQFPEYKEILDASGVTTALSGCILQDEPTLLGFATMLARQIEAFPWLRQARTANDIRAAHAAGEYATWGQCQWNRLRSDQLDLVDAGHALGVLHTADLAYNVMNFIGAGCTERYDPGLSYFGQDFVRRCNDVGVIVDTSHSGRQTTLDACETSSKPVIATHSAAVGVFHHDRAKSDEEIRAIAGTGGVIGICMVPFFLAPSSDTRPTIEVWFDHAQYIADLVGWEHLAIGTDWPMAWPDHMKKAFQGNAGSLGFRSEHNLDMSLTLDGYSDPRDTINITRGLVAHGYTDEQIQGILGENFLRVFEEVNG